MIKIMDGEKYIELTPEQAHKDFKCRFVIIDDCKTLRDEFAMAALTGILANPESKTHELFWNGKEYDFSIPIIWKIADATLEARGE